MSKKTTHWTSRSIKDFLYRIGADFIAQLEDKMESIGLKQVDLARNMDVTEGRVSQIINNPGNLTLAMIIKSVRAVGMKVAIVAYEDGDEENTMGPINSGIFRICWENAGMPHDFWDLEESQTIRQIHANTTSPEEATFIIASPKFPTDAGTSPGHMHSANP